MIAINAKPAFQHPRTGLEEYSYQLLTHLIYEARIRGLEKYLLFYAPTWSSIPQEFLSLWIKVIKAPYVWTQGRLALQLLWDNPEIFFNTEQKLPFFAPSKSVITIHDLAYEYYPEYYPTWHRRYLHIATKQAAKKAQKIIAVSERTKHDIAKFYGIPQRKIEVVYHGFSPPSRTIEKEVKGEINSFSFPTRERFFLFVGRIELKKNILTLIEAFEVFSKHIKEKFYLILAGTPGFGFKIIKKRIGASPERKRILLLGFINEHQKYELYQHASALVLVSLYEGFGLPILEAQSFGVPVIASNEASLPEVVGQAGILVPPQDSERIAKAMMDIVTHNKLRAYLVKKGYENLERFSWEKCAKETLDILLSL